LNTGKTVLTFGGLFGAYSTVFMALSVAGDYLYSISLDKLITKWDPVTGKKVFDFKDGASQSVVASGPFLAISVYNDYLYAVSSNGKVLKFEVNTGHCISAFGSGNWGGGSFRQIIHVFKEHIAVGYPGHLTLFKSDTGAIAFTLNPLEGLQSILFGSLSVQNACYFTVSGDYMYACQGSIIDKYDINQKKHILQGTIRSRNGTFRLHLNPVNCLQVSDNYIYSGSSDCLIKKWTK
jgi:WD40 repeat protein